MDLKEFQNSQQDILYQNGHIHNSHDMFLDLDDMWLGCLVCHHSWPSDSLKQACKITEVGC